MTRAPSVELARGIFHGAGKLYLDRFLNLPAARLPDERRAARGDGAAGPNGHRESERLRSYAAAFPAAAPQPPAD